MSLLERALGTLADRVPVASGRMVKELAQSVERTAGYVEQRARKGFFRRLAESLTGRKQTQVNHYLVGNQRGIVAELDDMRARSIALDLDVARVAGHLRDVQSTVDHVTDVTLRNSADISELAMMTSRLGMLVDVCQERLDSHAQLLGEHGAILAGHTAELADHARRLQVLELRNAATESLTTTTERWIDGHSYAALPWPVQVLFLGQEVANGPAGTYELVASRGSGGAPVDPEWFRRRLVRAITTNSGSGRGWPGQRLLVDVLAEAIDELASPDDRLMVAEIFGTGLGPVFASPEQGPLVTAFAGALDDAVGSGHAHADRARVARIVHQVIARRWMPARLTADAFVERAVAEQAASALAARAWMARVPGSSPSLTGLNQPAHTEETG